MNRSILPIAIILSLAVSFGASAQVVPPGAMNIGVQKMNDIAGGLNSLSEGHDCEGTGQSRKCTPYKLGALRLPIAQNLAVLNEKLTVFRSAADSLRTEVVTDKPPAALPANPTPEQTAEHQAAQAKFDKENAQLATEEQKLIDTPQSIVLRHLSLADLNIGDGPDKNPIPPTVLALLGPIVDGFDAPAQPVEQAKK